jgi:3-oxoacyl-[acyl-carrier protein] reductase
LSKAKSASEAPLGRTPRHDSPQVSCAATPNIRCDLDPARWPEHRFGLPKERWSTLAGRSVWVTGAGTGFGRSIATALAAAGARVFLSGRRTATLEQSLAHMRGLAVPTERCAIVSCDIRDESSVTAAAAMIRGATAWLHGLVNNAALPSPGGVADPLATLGAGTWRNLIETNLTGQWLVTKAALPLLLAGSSARVLFVTSEAGWAFTPGHGPYNVTKAALNNLGASFAAEFAQRHPDRDVQINVLVPGEARTEMNQGSTDSPYAVVPMALALLSHPPGGPSGYFFHRDGRHLAFAYAAPYGLPLL